VNPLAASPGPHGRLGSSARNRECSFGGARWNAGRNSKKPAPFFSLPLSPSLFLLRRSGVENVRIRRDQTRCSGEDCSDLIPVLPRQDQRGRFYDEDIASSAASALACRSVLSRWGFLTDSAICYDTIRTGTLSLSLIGFMRERKGESLITKVNGIDTRNDAADPAALMIRAFGANYARHFSRPGSGSAVGTL